MQTEQQLFAGIDISKEWFDVALCVVADHQRGPMHSERFSNNAAGIKAFEKWLQKQGMTDSAELLLVMENTGIYHRPLWGWCAAKKVAVHIGNAAHIKWSLGITRGKDDKTDAARLCNYAIKEGSQLKGSAALNPVILRLKDLWTSRVRLLRQRNANRVYLKELERINDAQTQKTLEKAYKGAIEGLSKSIAAIERQIKTLIKENTDIKGNYDLLCSIPGIGPLTALYLICCTANFISKPSGKQLCCYGGVAPFERSSGKSVRGRASVHKMANKDLKRLLHMGALSSLKSNQEIKDYWERKRKEGKHELSILNAIKAKLLLRVASVIKNQKKYTCKNTPEQQPQTAEAA